MDYRQLFFLMEAGSRRIPHREKERLAGERQRRHGQRTGQYRVERMSRGGTGWRLIAFEEHKVVKTQRYSCELS